MLKWVYFKVKQCAWVGLYNKHNNMHGVTVKINKTYFMFNKIFRKSYLLYDNVEKYGTARQASNNSIIGRIPFTCCINRTTDTHSDSILFIAFPRQQWWRESALILRYMYTACPFPEECLGVVCLFIQLRTAALRLIVRSFLDVPPFATRRLYACHQARAPSGGRWNCGRETSSNFAEMTTSTPFRNLLHAVKLRHGTDGFTFSPKEGVLRIFFALKIRRLRSSVIPRPWVP